MLADFHDPVDINALASLIAQAVKNEIALDLTKINEMWQLEGLDNTAPLQVTDTSRTVGTVIQQTINSTATSSTVTRT
jgi:hypothetical protein